MKTIDCIQISIASIKGNVLRSILTTLGIIIGVAAVIIMVAIGTGAQARVNNVIDSLGSNLIYVLTGNNLRGGVRLETGTVLTLTESDAQAIVDELPNVVRTAPSVNGSAQAVFGNQNMAASYQGVTPDMFIATDWQLANGRWMNETDVRSAAKVVWIGKTVVDTLFNGVDPMGQTIRIGHVPFRVQGVLASKGQAGLGRDQDDVIFMPISSAKRLIGVDNFAGGKVYSIAIEVANNNNIDLTEYEVEQLLRQRHRLRNSQDNDFNIFNSAQVLSARADTVRAFTLLLGAVAGVSLVVGGIGIMNIMLVSVTERTREIGLRMAMGARGRDILWQFIIEALLLSAIGGLIGVIIGLSGGYIMAYFADWDVVVTLNTLVLSFGFAASVGIFFGYYPARKAAQLVPIDALRHE